MSRQLMITSFQVGDGLTNLIVPTSGGTLAMLALGKVSYARSGHDQVGQAITHLEGGDHQLAAHADKIGQRDQDRHGHQRLARAAGNEQVDDPLDDA